MSFNARDNRSSSEADIRQVIAALESGEVVAIPTDTVYGLAAHLGYPEAIERIYAIKGRESTKAIPILIDAAERVEALSVDFPESGVALAKAFWPGALTLIVNASPSIPEVVHRGLGTVGLRMPDSSLARAVISAVGGALAVTSANLSGEPEAQSADEVRDALGSFVSVILDGGPAPGGRPSTVVDLTQPELRILRAGAIAVDEIARVVHR